MQTTGAYVDQIPPGARPPASAAPPALKIGPAAPAPSPPPGLYVQVASVLDQGEAVKVGLDLAQRLGPNRPRFFRGVAVTVEGQPRIRMFAGPFADEATAKRFCAAAIPRETCLLQVFAPGPPPAR